MVGWFSRWIEQRVRCVVDARFAALEAAIAGVAPTTCTGMTPTVEAVPQNVADTLQIPQVVAQAVQEGVADVVAGLEEVLATMHRIAPFA